MNELILVVDDESWVRTTVRSYLEEAGFRVITAADGTEAVRQFEISDPALVLLDWMLPELDGPEVARRIRRASDVPIIMLTARSEEEDRVQGLDLGADDYVVKPFSARELEARVRAVLRRTEGAAAPPPVMHAGDLHVNVEQREVRLHGRSVPLTAMEFDLLAFLMQHPGRVFTRLEILEALRGSTYKSFERSIDSHVKRLRQKIEPDPSEPRFVLTVFGVGYKFARGDET
ncbi:MAG: response regulator transcription factor [Candidatus Bipolaricaulota bacterium]|nr:MAG: response regulator transcription factor [Candidatus Bipolaricaulota bacterium]